MKKIIALAVIISCFSCNSNSETRSTSDSTTSEIGGVENANGNIPDTTNTGATPNSGDNRPHVDSSYADSTTKTTPH